MRYQLRFRIRIVIFLAFIVSIFCFSQETEYQLKALFFEQFSRFIEWPESSGIEDRSKPFKIAVIGDNPFGTLLHDTYKDQKIREKQVEISYPETPEDIGECHMLFISSSMAPYIKAIIDTVKNHPIFIISDTRGFAETGVHLNLYQENDNIKFEMNERAVHESGLLISYVLFNLSKVVDPIE